MPAYPNTEGGRQDIAFELRSSATGDVVAVAFSSLTKLVESLGHYQPWVAVSLERFRTLIGAIGAQEVIVDPQIDPSLRRIDAQQMRQFTRRSS
ncbi:MAG TPA: SAV_915 family protein [Pseudonocardiaceae bacterium]